MPRLSESWTKKYLFEHLNRAGRLNLRGRPATYPSAQPPQASPGRPPTPAPLVAPPPPSFTAPTPVKKARKMNQETSQSKFAPVEPDSLVETFLMIEDAFTMSEEHIVTEFHKFAKEHDLDREMADDILPAALAARLHLLREVEVIRTARVAIQENRATAGMLMAAVIAMEHMRQLVNPIMEEPL